MGSDPKPILVRLAKAQQYFFKWVELAQPYRQGPAQPYRQGH